jgi:hypothetical protein
VTNGSVTAGQLHTMGAPSGQLVLNGAITSLTEYH